MEDVDDAIDWVIKYEQSVRKAASEAQQKEEAAK